MKKIALWSMLFCLCATSGYAQRADVAKSTKEQKQEAKAVQGDILFKTAVEAIKARNFVWEFYNPRSTDKSKVCYNFMTIEGDSIYFQVEDSDILYRMAAEDLMDLEMLIDKFK